MEHKNTHSTPVTPQWIWSDTSDSTPVNRWTWFRHTFALDELPADGILEVAANSNARVYVNGQCVLRKVTRYDERHITTTSARVLQHLRVGRNVIHVLHHNWGDIVTFQRTGNLHAGLYVRSDFTCSSVDWQWLEAERFLSHEAQIKGIAGGASRIRFPVILSGSVSPPGDEHGWQPVVTVPDGVLKAVPQPTETPRQREYRVYPESVLNAGLVDSPVPDDAAVANDPYVVAQAFETQRLVPDQRLRKQAAVLVRQSDQYDALTFHGRAGDRFYVTLDFGMPVHGYPEIAASSTGRAHVDFGYGEIPVSIYSGLQHVTEDGAVYTEGVVGTGNADRITISGPETPYEIPDERTCRWLELIFSLTEDATVQLTSVTFIKSQYPIRPVGTFWCGDHEIEKYVRLALVHAEVTMTDVYVDTPGREDGQWDEDLRPRALLSERWFGDSSLRRVMLRTHAESQTEDGNLHPFAPSNYPFRSAPYDWSVQWVAALYDEYMWTGDKDIVQTYFEPLKRFWQGVIEKIDEHGLLATSFMLADIRVTAAMRSYYASGMVTPSIIQRLEWSVELAEVVGDLEAARVWKVAAKTLRESYRRYFVVAGAECSPPVDCPVVITDIVHQKPGQEDATRHAAYTNNAHPRGISQASHTFALQIDLLSEEEARRAVDAVFPDPVGSPPPGIVRWNNPSYSGRALSVLSKYGRSERALRHLRERMAPYLPRHPRNPVPNVLQGSHGGPLPEYQVRREDVGLQALEQTVWEARKAGNFPEANTAQPSDDTGSHGWAAIPLLWLHEHLLGVQIARPGGSEIRIQPDAAGLPYVAGHTVTPKGTVWVMWEPSEYRMEFTVPSGLTATVHVPRGYEHQRWTVVDAPDNDDAPHPRQNDGSFLLEAPGAYTLALD